MYGLFSMDIASKQAELHSYYDTVMAGICLIGMDSSEPILFVNQEILDMYHCADEEAFYRFTGRTLRGMVEDGDYHPLGQSGDPHMPKRISFRFRTLDDGIQQVEGAAKVITLDGEKVWLVQLISNEMKSSVSGIDSLTDTLTMHRFFERVLQLAQMEKPKDRLSVYCPTYFNLTNFRLYNAIHGLALGDRCLKHIAVTLMQYFPTALITRLSADGFAVLAPRDDLFPKIEAVCGQINDYVHNPNIRLKAGVCLLNDSDAPRIRHAFDMAKVACDTIKSDATRCWTVYSRDMGGHPGCYPPAVPGRCPALYPGIAD